MTRNKYLALAVFFGLCVFHVAGVMGHLVREGRLSMVPVYDDVTYLVDGFSRLAVLDRGGIVAFIADLHAHPAHAPLMAAAAAFGFLISGGAAWGPYLLNSLWVLVSAALVLLILRGVDFKSRIGIAIAVLAAPLFGIAVVEFRPDPVWGLLVGLSVALLATVDLACANRLRLFLLGLLVGTAVLAKPTAAPASVAVIAATYLGCVGSTFALRGPVHWRALASNSLVVAFGAGIVVIPYIITSGSEILAYILMVMASGNSVWRTETDALGHITYYLNRSYGPLSLGWVWYAALPVTLLSLAALIHAKDRRSLCAFVGIACGLVMAYAIVTVSSVKSPMIGSILYGTIIAAVAWASAQIVRHVPVRHGIVLIVGAVIFLTQWVPKVGMVQRADLAMQTTDQATRAAFPIVLQALRTHANNRVVVTVPGPVYAGSLDFMARQQGTVGSFNEAYTWDTWGLFMQGIDTCDVVILSEAGMRGQALGYNFPSVAFQPRLLQHLRADAAFDGKAVFTDEQGRSVWVFVRK